MVAVCCLEAENLLFWIEEGSHCNHQQVLHLSPKSEEIFYLLVIPQLSLYLSYDEILWNCDIFLSISGTSLLHTLFSTWKKWVATSLVSICLLAFLLQYTMFIFFWFNEPTIHQPGLALNAYGASFLFCSNSNGSRAFAQFASLNRQTSRLSSQLNWFVIWSKYFHCFKWDGCVISALSKGRSSFV